MSDNDLIRRGDALEAVAGWEIPSTAISAVPAVTALVPSERLLPEVGSVIRALDSVIAEMHHLRAALRGLEERG